MRRWLDKTFGCLFGHHLWTIYERESGHDFFYCFRCGKKG